MYFSQNKKTSERRANDEYLRRASSDRGVSPAASNSPTPPEPPQEAPEEAPYTARPLAMVYAPSQTFQNLYEPDEALSRGTLFAELDLPFEGRSVTRR